MAVTQIDLDEDALAEVMRISGARTKKDAVNLALRELALTHRRRDEWERTTQFISSLDYEGWRRLRDEEDEAPNR